MDAHESHAKEEGIVCSATHPFDPFLSFSLLFGNQDLPDHAHARSQGISPTTDIGPILSFASIQEHPMAQIYRTLASARSSTTSLTRIGTLCTQRCFNSSALLFRDDGYGGSIFEKSDRDKKKRTSSSSSSSSDTPRRQDSGKYGRSSFVARERPSSSSSDDPFEKMDSGKYGRSSYPSRERSSSSYSSSSSAPPSRSFERSDRSSSSDRYGSQGSRSFDRPSFGSGGDRRAGGMNQSSGERTYDPEFSPTKRGGPSQNMDPDRDYLYSPNVVMPAILNGYRTPYKLYYSKTIIQNRKKYMLCGLLGAISSELRGCAFLTFLWLLVA